MSDTLPRLLLVIVVILGLSVLLMLAGQTVSVFDYDLAVRVGMQESEAEVGAYGVRFNRAFAAADTAVYVPLMILSIVGLLRRKRWALVTTAGVAAMSVYWTATIAFAFLFLPGVPSYTYDPPAGIWLFLAAYFVLGVVGLTYVAARGDKMLPPNADEPPSSD